MKFKRTLAAFAALICLACGVSAAAADTAAVYVTVADGNLKLAQEQIEVTDTDGDGKLTVNDAPPRATLLRKQSMGFRLQSFGAWKTGEATAIMSITPPQCRLQTK